MVGDMLRVTLHFDLSKIPFVHFTGSHLRAVTDAAEVDDDDDDADNAGRHSTTTRATYRQ